MPLPRRRARSSAGKFTKAARAGRRLAGRRRARRLAAPAVVVRETINTAPARRSRGRSRLSSRRRSGGLARRSGRRSIVRSSGGGGRVDLAELMYSAGAAAALGFAQNQGFTSFIPASLAGAVGTPGVVGGALVGLAYWFRSAKLLEAAKGPIAVQAWAIGKGGFKTMGIETVGGSDVEILG